MRRIYIYIHIYMYMYIYLFIFYYSCLLCVCVCVSPAGCYHLSLSLLVFYQSISAGIILAFGYCSSQLILFTVTNSQPFMLHYLLYMVRMVRTIATIIYWFSRIQAQGNVEFSTKYWHCQENVQCKCDIPSVSEGIKNEL